MEKGDHHSRPILLKITRETLVQGPLGQTMWIQARSVFVYIDLLNINYGFWKFCIRLIQNFMQELLSAKEQQSVIFS